MMADAAQVKQWARDAGFDDCRIARADAAAHAAEFVGWLAAGKHGDMQWLARDPARRSDPRAVLPGCRSVICLALNYHPGDAPGWLDWRVARYAWNDDYHELIAKRLERLDAELQACGGSQKPYVDTGPVLERDMAGAAGLGWNGKSTVQIHPRLGTWFFLAEILTTLELEPDPASVDRCGTCTRCMAACPTGAITAPHEMDARRCLSYLTIEAKGPIPVEFRRALGNRLYGCDDCLAACPWNRFATRAREASFHARERLFGMRARDFLALDDAGFRGLFHGSPILRLKRARFLRNVCVVLGNTGGPDDLPALRRAAADPDPLIAEHAHWAVGEIRQRHGMC